MWGSRLNTLLQAQYASEFLYVLSLCLAKMATLQFLFTLARSSIRRTIVRGIIAFDASWTIIALLCIAFQCPLPRPWTVLSNKCFNQVCRHVSKDFEYSWLVYKSAFWDVFGTFDILLDVSIMALPVYLLRDLHVVRAKKMSTILAFFARLL